MIRRSATVLGMLLLLVACTSGGQTPEPTESGPPNSATATATKEPRESPAPEPSPTSAEETPDAAAAGMLRGQVCYPSEFVPEMTAFFQDVESGDVLTLAIAENQTSYEMSLPPATYLVFAYLVDTPTLGAVYSAAVPCGLDATCTDHSPLPVSVEPGAIVTGIDLCDWYDQDAVPERPQG